VKSFEQILSEGLYDPGIFKAFFLAGGPGSGKSFVTRNVFSGSGLKIVNSDIIFENSLKKMGLSLSMPDEEQYFRDIMRTRAKATTENQLDLYIKGRLGLVVDATGRDFNIIQSQAGLLKQLGYDCYMVFVNTSLEVALKETLKEKELYPNILQNNHGKVFKIILVNFKIILVWKIL